MKIKQLTTLKHKLQWLLLLTLITTSQSALGDQFWVLGDIAGGWNDGDKKELSWYSGDDNGKYRRWIVLEGGDYYFRIKQTWDNGGKEITNTGTMSCGCSNWEFWDYIGNNDACKFSCSEGGEFVFHLHNWKYVNVWRQDYSLVGSMNSWNESSNVFSTGTTCTASVSLDASTDYSFKLRAKGTDTYYTCNTNKITSSITDYALNSNTSEDLTMQTTVGGSYVFQWDIANKKLAITYPTPKIKGSWDSWTEHNMTVSSATSITWTNTFSSAGKYEFVIMPTTGTGDYKNKNFTRSNNSQTLQQNTGSNATVVIDHPGSYTFTWDSTTGALTITYPTPSTPAALYIKGPLVNNGTWTSDYRQNWSSMTYNKTNNVYTFSFNASNACNNCSDQPRHFCVSTGEDDNGKIHWAMNSTRTNWDFVNNEGSNFVASSSLVTGTSVPVVLTITYDASTYKYNMELTACTSPTVVTTEGAESVTSSSATVKGTVTTSIGTCAVTEAGIAYGTSPNPESGQSVSYTSGTEFSANLTGLTAGTTYYYRAYATTASGNVYGSEYSFTTSSSCSDPVISVQPSGTWSKCGNAEGRQLSITASGGSGTLTYQWFRNTTNTLTDGVADLTGATAVTDMVEGGNTYSPSASDYGKFYYCCVVRSGGACSANKATSVYTGEIEIKQTPTVKPSTITVKQYEPVRLQATNSSVNWSITTHPEGAADEYYLYDETKNSAMFKGKTGSYTVTATSTGSECTSTSAITVENDPNTCN